MWCTTVAAQVAATSPHQPRSATLTTLAGFTWPADAAGTLTNNGAGILSWGAGGGGITINTTAITGGTSTALLYDNGSTVGKLDIFLEASAILQMGADVNGAAVAQTIKAHDGITGTDVSGGSLTLSGGNSTGTGTSSVKIATPAAGATGTTVRTSATRITVTSEGLQIQATTAPTSNPPTGAFILYVDPADNTLRARGSSGTITILATP
jgi:hypothetical protein